MKISEKEWKKKLTEEEYNILRKKGTEPAFTGKYYYNKEKGEYLCKGCGSKLFSSDAKFESGTGWPSFFAPMKKNNIEYKEDLSHNMKRIEIRCKKCKCHLGHFFEDGPNEKRFCVNSCSLEFKKIN